MAESDYTYIEDLITKHKEDWEDSEKRREILNQLQSRFLVFPIRSGKNSIIKEIRDAN